jgi:hypothetical protein
MNIMKNKDILRLFVTSKSSDTQMEDNQDNCFDSCFDYDDYGMDELGFGERGGRGGRGFGFGFGGRGCGFGFGGRGGFGFGGRGCGFGERGCGFGERGFDFGGRGFGFGGGFGRDGFESVE